MNPHFFLYSAAFTPVTSYDIRFGYEPRSDTEKLKAAKALHKRRHTAAVLMQAHMRAYLGKKRAAERYREWVMAALLCKVQARVRGVLARSRWQKRRLAALTQRCATSVAAAMRGTMGRRRVAQIRSGVSDNRRNEVSVRSFSFLLVSFFPF